MLLFAPPDRQEQVRQELGELIHASFDFEYSGSSIIFFDPENDYSAAEKARAQQTVSGFRELNPEP